MVSRYLKTIGPFDEGDRGIPFMIALTSSSSQALGTFVLINPARR
jgi:hypothetical protein